MSLPTPLKELGKHRVVDMSLGPTHSTVLVEMGRVSVWVEGGVVMGVWCIDHH